MSNPPANKPDDFDAFTIVQDALRGFLETLKADPRLAGLSAAVFFLHVRRALARLAEIWTGAHPTADLESRLAAIPEKARARMQEIANKAAAEHPDSKDASDARNASLAASVDAYERVARSVPVALPLATTDPLAGIPEAERTRIQGAAHNAAYAAQREKQQPASAPYRPTDEQHQHPLCHALAMQGVTEREAIEALYRANLDLMRRLQTALANMPPTTTPDGRR